LVYDLDAGTVEFGWEYGDILFAYVVFEKTPGYELSMPRSARIDAPGALHHVIGRGIERRKIFGGDCDRDDLNERLERILREIQTACYAWGPCCPSTCTCG